MDFDKIIEKRRSIRQYITDRTISIESIEKLIACAQEAPTWKNSQTGRYYVAIGNESKKQMLECLAQQNQKVAESASALIVTTFVSHRSGFERSGEPTNELKDGWGCYDLGMQNAFLLLKATDMGIDSIVLGLRDADALRHVLNIPSEEIIVSVIALGYRDNDVMRPKRRQTADILHVM